MAGLPAYAPVAPLSPEPPPSYYALEAARVRVQSRLSLCACTAVAVVALALLAWAVSAFASPARGGAIGSGSLSYGFFLLIALMLLLITCVVCTVGLQSYHRARARLGALSLEDYHAQLAELSALMPAYSDAEGVAAGPDGLPLYTAVPTGGRIVFLDAPPPAYTDQPYTVEEGAAAGAVYEHPLSPV
jgi:hypothetical protein